MMVTTLFIFELNDHFLFYKCILQNLHKKISLDTIPCKKRNHFLIACSPFASFLLTTYLDICQ